MTAKSWIAVAFALIAAVPISAAQAQKRLEAYEIAKEAYIYAFPMIAAYKALYQFNVDKTSSQYKGPFNTVLNTARVFTPKDTAIVTPNSDTPYSMLQLDLRAEPIVLCVPKIEAGRYFSVQLTDMYSFNTGYMGTRTTGNNGGCFLIAGPDWKGEKPAGISQVFRSETQFGLVIIRTQLFNPADIENVKKIQAGYEAKPLSAFLGTTPPPPPPQIEFLPFSEDAFKLRAFEYLNFLLQFAPAIPEEAELRARFAEIGIEPGKPYVLPAAGDGKVAIELGIKEGYEAIVKRKSSLGTLENGWRVSSAFGDRAFYNGDFEMRAAAALAGIFGNDSVEALYPMAAQDNKGQPLDASQHTYTITFPADGFPPVNAFWSITMYDGKTQLLIDNPINRYLINSPMLPGLKTNSDGSLTIYVQHNSPGPDKASNWLPAPDGPIYMVMRLYLPKKDALDGTWKPAVITQASK